MGREELKGFLALVLAIAMMAIAGGIERGLL